MLEVPADCDCTLARFAYHSQSLSTFHLCSSGSLARLGGADIPAGSHG